MIQPPETDAGGEYIDTMPYKDLVQLVVNLHNCVLELQHELYRTQHAVGLRKLPPPPAKAQQGSLL